MTMVERFPDQSRYNGLLGRILMLLPSAPKARAVSVAGTRLEGRTAPEAARDIGLRAEYRDYGPSADLTSGSEARLHRSAERLAWTLPR